MNKRVVITGMGVIAPNGIGKEAFWEALRTGKSGIKKITSFNASGFPCQIAGEINEDLPLDFLDKKAVRRMARSSRLAVSATRMAMVDAGFNDTLPGHVRSSITLGISSSAIDVIEKDFKVFLERGHSAVSPCGILAVSPHAAVSEVVKMVNRPGLGETLGNDCTAGLDAIGLTYLRIRAGDISLGICGGVDAPISPLLWGWFCQGDLIPSVTENPESASRPFDAKRTVGIISEGAAVFVLEEMAQARYRHAAIYGEIIGFGNNSENSLDEGLKKSMEIAITQASLLPGSVDYISAHGPSHHLVDKIETDAIKKLFGSDAYRIPVSSIKSMIGNPLAAGGPLQVAALPLTFQEGLIPPTMNYHYPDPACDLDYVPNRPRYNEVKLALVNSHGIGGGNSSLLIKKCPI